MSPQRALRCKQASKATPVMDREFATQRGAGNGRFAWWVPARLEIVLIWLANISHVYYFTKVDARLSSAHSLILV